MTEIAQIMMDWWSLMADMHEKYGDAHDIEEQPEWLRLQETQQELVRLFRKRTKAPADMVFDKIQEALLLVLGTEERVLNFEDAEEVAEFAIKLIVHEEAQAARTAAVVN